MLLYTENRLYYIWYALVVACAIYLAIFIPLNLQFDFEDSILLISLYWLCTSIFIADAIVQFIHMKKGRTAPGRRSRVTGWVIIDVIAAIPFEVLTGPGPIQYLRLTKLVRVAQFIRLFKQTEIRYSIGLTLISFVFWMVLLIHWLSCGWLAVHGLDSGADNTTNYVSALYWTVSTLTSVGYGDIVPLTNVQRLYAVVVQITGIGVFGYVVGNVVSIVSRTDQVKAKYAENIEMFTTAVKRRSLPLELQKRILAYYSYLRDQKMGYDESAFLHGLPKGLRTEVALNLKKEFIEGIPLFRHASEKFIVEIALKLELIVVTPGATLFKAGDIGNEMYFIISGNIQVLNRENEEIVMLKEGDFFGEIALFKHQPRSATVKAVTYCNLYKLKRRMFEDVVANHPEIAEQIEEVARERERR